eukprot:3828654-Rhodomonas_salina.1
MRTHVTAPLQAQVPPVLPYCMLLVLCGTELAYGASGVRRMVLFVYGTGLVCGVRYWPTERAVLAYPMALVACGTGLAYLERYPVWVCSVQHCHSA